MGARYYNSKTGRWITRDSYKGDQIEPLTKNKYTYVENNPVNKVDSTGYWADWRHGNWTLNWATQVGFKYRRTVAKGTYDLDGWWQSAVFHPSWHFDYMQGSGKSNDSRYRYFIMKWREAVRLARKRKPMAGSYQLGLGLHSYQDIFAHGYISKWEHGIDYRLGGILHIKYKGRYNSKPDDPNWPGDPNYVPNPKYETQKGWPGYPKRVLATGKRTKYYLLKFKEKYGRYF